jgi:dienelactone hydrolase
LDAAARTDGRQGDAQADATTDGAAADASARSAEPDPGCTRNGCLRGVEHLGEYTTLQIAPLLQPGVFIDNGYSVYLLRLWTDGRETLATVTVPLNAEVPADGFHIVANSHGTSGVDDPCSLAGDATGVGLAGLFGARGAIGVAPEYPGLGTEGVHPYLVSEVEGRAVLDSLRAARNLAEWLGVSHSGKYAAVGASQGGHATLAAAALHSSYAPELDLRAFGASAPSAVWAEHWRPELGYDGLHVVFHAMIVYAWLHHYEWDGPSPWAEGRAEAVDDAMREECVLSSTGENLTTRLGTLRHGIFSQAFLDAYSGGPWGDFGAFEQWFEENRLGPYEQTAPLRIYQGGADSVVPETRTADLVRALRDGGVELDYEVVPAGTHGTVAFGFLAQNQYRTRESVEWVFGQLNADRD